MSDPNNNSTGEGHTLGGGNNSEPLPSTWSRSGNAAPRIGRIGDWGGSASSGYVSSLQLLMRVPMARILTMISDGRLLVAQEDRRQVAGAVLFLHRMTVTTTRRMIKTEERTGSLVARGGELLSWLCAVAQFMI